MSETAWEPVLTRDLTRDHQRNREEYELAIDAMRAAALLVERPAPVTPPGLPDYSHLVPKSWQRTIQPYALVRDKLLDVLGRMGQGTCVQVAKALKMSESTAGTALSRYARKGLIRRVNPGVNPAVYQALERRTVARDGAAA
jgi:hypothetical protein